MQYFATHEKPRSLRANQYRKERKVKTKLDGNESPAEHEDAVDPRPKPTTQSHAAFASPALAQLRVAGLLPEDEDEVPPAPFPHAPAKASGDHYGPAKVQEEMASSPSRLYAVNATSKSDPVLGQHEGQKKSHLNTLSTLMHRCLLEGDYQRAGRAWGMILRTQMHSGRPVDPRQHERWGIGGEIVLRRKSEMGKFSEPGFELAREYYERLIVQHPARKAHPRAIDERTFYPAMFSLWVFEVCEKSKQARARLQDEASHRRSSTSMSIDHVHVEELAVSREEEDAIQLEELTRAMEIADRIDQLVTSPPFDKQGSLLQLRANIGLWISDLTIEKTNLHENSKMDLSGKNRNYDSEADAEQLRWLMKGYQQLQDAEKYFERAKTNDAQIQAETMSSVNTKLKEVASQITKLRAAQQDGL
jgi:hypothetical protein